MTTWPGTSIPKSTRNAFDWRAGMPQPVETSVCTKCGEEKPTTTFKSSGKCGACRYQEQLMRKRTAGLQQGGHEMNEREMDLEDLITSRSGDVLRLQAKADAAMPEMAKVWRDEARRAAADVARLVAMRSPEAVRRLEREMGLEARRSSVTV